MNTSKKFEIKELESRLEMAQLSSAAAADSQRCDISTGGPVVA